MASIFQYIRDTQGELRHVSWPTRTQTVVYTVLVASLSIIVALYLGFFDFLFTSSLTRVVGALPGSEATIPAAETTNPLINITPIEGSGASSAEVNDAQVNE